MVTRREETPIQLQNIPYTGKYELDVPPQMPSDKLMDLMLKAVASRRDQEYGTLHIFFCTGNRGDEPEGHVHLTMWTGHEYRDVDQNEAVEIIALTDVFGDVAGAD